MLIEGHIIWNNSFWFHSLFGGNPKVTLDEFINGILRCQSFTYTELHVFVCFFVVFGIWCSICSDTVDSNVL